MNQFTIKHDVIEIHRGKFNGCFRARIVILRDGFFFRMRQIEKPFQTRRLAINAAEKWAKEIMAKDRAAEPMP